MTARADDADAPGVAPGLRRRGIWVPRQVTERVEGLPPDFWWLWLGQLVNRAGTFVVPFLALYVTRGRGLSEETAGTVLLAWGIGQLPAQPFGGWLADRVGRVRTLLVATTGSAIALIALGSSARPATLVASAALLGVFGESYRPAVAALIADVVPVADRPRAFGLQFWAINLGFALATSVAGIVSGVSWFLLFVGDAITTMVFGLVVVWRVREPTRPSAPERPDGAPGSIAVVLADRLFLGVLVVSFVYALLYAQVFATLSLQVVADGLSEADFGTLIAVNGVVIVLVQPVVITRIQTWRPGNALALAALVIGTGLGTTVFASTWPTYALTIVVWTLGEIVGATFVAPVVADLAPDDMRGRYQGWFGFAFAGAFAVGPSLGVTVFDRFGGAPVWAGCFVIGLVVAVSWLAMRDAVDARRQPGPA